MRNLILAIAIAVLTFTMPGNGLCPDEAQAAGMQAMTVAQLELAGDNCRAQKDYEHAIQYFKEGLRRERRNTNLYNKLGLAELASGDYGAARADFNKATKYDSRYPDAWNNLGATLYVEKKYGAAAKYFKKAIALDETRAAFHVNLGATWFAQNDVERAMREYTRALELDPEALARKSNIGVTAQITNREERAKHDYMLARIYAKMGSVDNCLMCLRNAKENGYGNLDNVYKDQEFSALWQDARLAQIVPPPMAK